MGGRHLATLDARAARERRVLEAGHIEALGAVVPVEDELGVLLHPHRLGWEAADVGVEEELHVEGDVAVAAELGVVLDEQLARVGDVARRVVLVRREGQVGAHELHPAARPLFEPLRLLPRKDTVHRRLRVEVVERHRARHVELGRVYGHRCALPRERTRAKREAALLGGGRLRVVDAAQMDADLRRDVDGNLAHYDVGHGGDACGDDHPDGVGGSRVVDGEDGGGKVLDDALEQQHQVELLRVEQRRAPHTRLRLGLFGAVGEGQRQQLGKRVLDERDLEEGRVLDSVRLDTDQRAQPVAVAHRRDSLVERADDRRLLQHVNGRVARQLVRRASVNRLASEQPIAQRVDVRHLGRRGGRPRKGARVLAHEPDAVGRDERAILVEQHERRDRGHVEDLRKERGQGAAMRQCRPRHARPMRVKVGLLRVLAHKHHLQLVAARAQRLVRRREHRRSRAAAGAPRRSKVQPKDLNALQGLLDAYLAGGMLRRRRVLVRIANPPLPLLWSDGARGLKRPRLPSRLGRASSPAAFPRASAPHAAAANAANAAATTTTLVGVCRGGELRHEERAAAPLAKQQRERRAAQVHVGFREYERRRRRCRRCGPRHALQRRLQLFDARAQRGELGERERELGGR